MHRHQFSPPSNHFFEVLPCTFFRIFLGILQERLPFSTTITITPRAPSLAHLLHFFDKYSLLYFLDTYSLPTSSLNHKTLCIVINFLLLQTISLKSILVHFLEFSWVSHKRGYPVIYSFDEIYALSLGFKNCSCFSEVLFSYLFSSLIVPNSTILEYFEFSFSSSVILLSLFCSSNPSVASRLTFFLYFVVLFLLLFLV